MHQNKVSPNATSHISKPCSSEHTQAKLGTRLSLFRWAKSYFQVRLTTDDHYYTQYYTQYVAPDITGSTLLFQLLHSIHQWLVSKVSVVDHEHVEHHKTLLHARTAVRNGLHVHIISFRPEKQSTSLYAFPVYSETWIKRPRLGQEKVVFK